MNFFKMKSRIIIKKKAAIGSCGRLVSHGDQRIVDVVGAAMVVCATALDRLLDVAVDCGAD